MNYYVNKMGIVLFGALCLFATVDTDLFIYPVMSQYLMYGSFALLLVFIGLIVALSKGAKAVGASSVILVMWGLYILLHSVFVKDAEEYRLVYILTSILLMLSLSVMLRTGQLTFRWVQNGCLLMLVLHLGSLVSQFLGFVKSGNDFFALTGLNLNPNATAMLLAVCLPMVYDKLKTSRHVYFLLTMLVLSICFLYVLKCRTAFVGLATIVLVRLLTTDKVRYRWGILSRQSKALLLSIACVLSFVAIIGMNHAKKGSSDGRLLIWKVSADMIVHNPVGSGIGMFQREYNLRQGEYFASDRSTEEERMTADAVYMAYNDYLEHGVEAGVIGMCFMLSFYVSLMISVYRQHDYSSLSIVVGFAVMSLVNFAYTSIQTWIVMMCYAGYVMSREKPIVTRCVFSRLYIIVLLVSCVSCGTVHFRHTYAQDRLKSIKEQHTDDSSLAISELKELATAVGTSEAYWNTMADCYCKENDYEKALRCYDNALKYATEPRILFRCFMCCDRMDKTKDGITYLEKVCAIIPQNLMARYILMQWYDKCGNTTMALRYADDIVSLPLRVRNEKSDAIQEEARKYKDNNSNNNKEK